MCVYNSPPGTDCSQAGRTYVCRRRLFVEKKNRLVQRQIKRGKQRQPCVQEITRSSARTPRRSHAHSSTTTPSIYLVGFDELLVEVHVLLLREDGAGKLQPVLVQHRVWHLGRDVQQRVAHPHQRNLVGPSHVVIWCSLRCRPCRLSGRGERNGEQKLLTIERLV